MYIYTYKNFYFDELQQSPELTLIEGNQATSTAGSDKAPGVVKNSTNLLQKQQIVKGVDGTTNQQQSADTERREDLPILSGVLQQHNSNANSATNTVRCYFIIRIFSYL